MNKKNKNFKHKYSNISYKYKVKEMSDEVKVLNSGLFIINSQFAISLTLFLEIEELQKECKVIKKENKERESKSIKLIQNDKAHDNRMNGLKDTLTEAKNQIAKLENLKAQQNAEYDMSMSELRKIDNEFRTLREK